MQLRACHILQKWDQKSSENRLQKKIGYIFSTHHNGVEDCLLQMGCSQLQEAINKMSRVLLTITCSIRGVFKCLDCRHNLFFVTIYCQHTRSTLERSDYCRCQAEIAARLPDFIFLSWSHFIGCSSKGKVNFVCDWQCPDVIRWEIRGSRYRLCKICCRLLSQRHMFKMSITAELLLHTVQVSEKLMSLLCESTCYLCKQRTVPRLDEMWITVLQCF